MQSFGIVLAVLILGLFTAPSNWTQLMVLAALTLVSLFHWLDTAVEAGWMPAHTVGWLRKPEWAATYVAVAVQIVAYCLIELMFVFVLNAARSSHPLLASSTNRNVLARIAFSAVVLVYIGWQGCAMYTELDWQRTVEAATAHERLYVYIPRMHFTCAVMTSFQVKNLIDTLRWRDGPEFVAHHIATIVVGVCCDAAAFCHLYGIFYFGISEVSTAFVSTLAAFDPHHGIAALSEHLPLTKAILGGGFIVSFLIIRIVIWPIVSWWLVSDTLVVLNDGTAHSTPVVAVIMTMLSGLTILQFVWLGEIFRRVRDELAQIRQTMAGRSKVA